MSATLLSVPVALDWTPNANHTGFYVAKANGWYKDLGLDVTLISPHTDAYKTTPLARVADKSALFGICPSESVVSYNTWPDSSKPRVKAVATLLQSSTSAVVTLKESGIDRPAKLDGKKYASYGARYEGRIVQSMIKHDGGRGEFSEETPPMLGIWNTLLKKEADATWVFLGWEGVEAQQKGVELNVFRPEDYGVQYGYSPLLVAHPDLLSSDPATVRTFLSATARGFEFAAAHPEAAAEQLLAEVAEDTQYAPLPTPLEPELVRRAQAFTGKAYCDSSGKWGTMATGTWDAFLDWLADQKLLTTKVQSRAPATGTTTSLDGLRAGDTGEHIPRSSVQSASLFTNEFLPTSQA